MTEDYDTAKELRERADSTAAAEAFARGDVTLTFAAAATVELPPTPEGDVMVVRSIRLPADLEVRAKAIAEARAVPYSALIRDWIADGLERAEAGEQRDPVTELHRIADAAQRALRVLEGRRHAA
jgi:predicted phosphoribosyltransferase